MPNDVDFDPIALLQALGQTPDVETPAPDQESGSDNDLFAGSGPVDIQAANEQAAQAATPEPDPVAAVDPAQVANVSQDGIVHLLREALLALETRVAAIERHATRNGWPL